MTPFSWQVQCAARGVLMPDPTLDPVRAFCYVSREEGADDAEAAVPPPSDTGPYSRAMPRALWWS